MDSMKRVVLFVLFGSLLLLGAQAAFAADQIAVTVTLQQVIVSVLPTSWELDVMAPDTSKSSWVSGNAGHFEATNDGNVAEDLTIEASSSSYWAPGETVAVNVFVIGFGIGSGDYTSEPTYTTFTTATSLATSVAVDGTVDFDLEFTAPLTDSETGASPETITVSLAASAS